MRTGLEDVTQLRNDLTLLKRGKYTNPQHLELEGDLAFLRAENIVETMAKDMEQATEERKGMRLKVLP